MRKEGSLSLGRRRITEDRRFIAASRPPLPRRFGWPLPGSEEADDGFQGDVPVPPCITTRLDFSCCPWEMESM